jgi:hypothetical protein
MLSNVAFKLNLSHYFKVIEVGKKTVKMAEDALDSAER